MIDEILSDQDMTRLMGDRLEEPPTLHRHTFIALRAVAGNGCNPAKALF
jgi:hypothetical protein